MLPGSSRSRRLPDRHPAPARSRSRPRSNRWNEQHRAGIVFDGTAGFRLPNGTLRAADVAWLRLDVWNSLTHEQCETFAHLSPDFVVEIRSPSDRLAYQRSKMEEWMDNGCRLGWLIDPGEQTIYVHCGRGEVEVTGFDIELTGGDVLFGFLFNPRTLP